jgi:hypothetical protein
MSATTMLAGNRSTTSVLMPMTVTILPCQWGGVQIHLRAHGHSVPAYLISLLHLHQGHVAEDKLVYGVHQVALVEALVLCIHPFGIPCEVLYVVVEVVALVLVEDGKEGLLLSFSVQGHDSFSRMVYGVLQCRATDPIYPPPIGSSGQALITSGPPYCPVPSGSCL